MLRLEVTTDYNLITKYLPLLKDTEYLIAYHGDDELGAYMLTKKNGEIEIHQNLKNEAVEHHRTLGKMVLKNVFKSNNRAVTYINDTRRTMVNYLLKIGFKYEGCKREAFFNQGHYYDVHMLGIVKRDSLWDL